MARALTLWRVPRAWQTTGRVYLVVQMASWCEVAARYGLFWQQCCLLLWAASLKRGSWLMPLTADGDGVRCLE